MPTLKPSQLKSQVSMVLEKAPRATIIGFRTRNRWEGGSHLHIHDRKFLVAQCGSSLALREAAIDAREAGNPLVVVTDLNDSDLGDDVRALMAKRRLIPVRPWESVKELFRAKKIDPSIIRKQWLAEALLDVVPEAGFDVVPNGYLSAERVWSEILDHLVGLDNQRPDVRDILIWSREGSNVSKFQSLPNERKADITSWIRHCAGETGKFLMEVCGLPQSHDLLSLGLCCEAIFSGALQENPVLHDAAIRLEKFVGDRPVEEETARKWGAVARDIYSDLIREGRQDDIRSIQEKLDHLLQDLGMQDHLWRSTVSPMGFEQRLVRFSEALIHLLNKRTHTDFTPLSERLQALETHACAVLFPERIERAKMAFRLMRWLDASKKQDQTSDFSKAAAAYMHDGGFVDWARNSLYMGDGCPEQSKAFSRILLKADKQREEENRHFAELLVQWTAAGSSGGSVCRIEDVLKEVVAPFARQDRVLFIVMDGMNMAVFSELKESLLADTAWVEIGPKPTDGIKPIVALFPTVTDVCRRSLLCGRRASAAKDSEIKGFAENQVLKACSGDLNPVLFLKSDLMNSDGTQLAEGVRNEIHGRRKIVGAVVNVVDDFLYKSDQLAVSWQSGKVPALEKLMYAARMADRLVIMTSDHGHVLDHKVRCHKHEDGERWRSDDHMLRDGEIRIQGDRVLKPESGKLIAPWSERIRYGSKKNGYHGGLTPQEVLVPLLAMKWRPEGNRWNEVPSHRPDWWSCELEQLPLDSKPKQKSPRISTEDFQNISAMPLFAGAPKTQATLKDSLIDRLMGSPILFHQKELCGRAAPADEKIMQFLQALDRHGGTMLQTAMAREMKQPLFRFRGIISMMQRILNVDGYPVLGFDTASDTISLNSELMKTQFEL